MKSKLKEIFPLEIYLIHRKLRQSITFFLEPFILQNTVFIRISAQSRISAHPKGRKVN